MTWTALEILGLGGSGMLFLFYIAIAARLSGIRSRVSALSRVEAKVDLLLKQANIRFDPHAHLPREIVEAMQAGRKIEAIKLYRQSAKVGLKEAKEFIEEVGRRADLG